MGSGYSRTLAIRITKEVLLLFLGIYIYEQCYLLAGMAFSNTNNFEKVALDNAQLVISVEKFCFCFWELSWQGVFLQTGVSFIKAVNFFYMTFHLPVCIAFWILNLYTCLKGEKNGGGVFGTENERELMDLEISPVATFKKTFQPDIRYGFYDYAITSDGYRIMRNAFILSHVFICGTSVFFPCAPPRMCTGFVDTILVYTHTHLKSMEERLMINPYAAMPSLHFGYANWVGGGLIFWGNNNWWRFLGILYQVLVLTAIVITGNHFFLDALVSAVFNCVSLYLSYRFITPFFDPNSAGSDNRSD